jgi:signal transduction histidine kinase
VLYTLVALTLVGLVGGVTYLLIERYLQRTTDLAIQHRLTDALASYGSPIPPDLATADQDWLAARGRSDHNSEDDRKDNDDKDDDSKETPATPVPTPPPTIAEAFDGDLAAVFVLALRTDGSAAPIRGVTLPDIAPDRQALAAAMNAGTDWRTVPQTNGTLVRLHTYRLIGRGEVVALQLGRPLDDQQGVLRQLTLVLGSASAAGAVVLGLGSWWLAGRALRPAQEAWHRQQRFVANASHELRAPLTLLRASVEFAYQDVPPANHDQRALLDDAIQECDHMARLVEDLLLLSRLDAGKLPLDLHPLAIHDVLDDVARQVGRAAAGRNVAVSVQNAAGTVRADPLRLRQVLLIVLDNGLRHTPAGGSITLTGDVQGHTATITISDTGSGIAAEDLPRLFERFYQGDSSHATGGSGLGLPIARGLIESHGGRISIASTLGCGTQVTITLPDKG